MWSAGFVVRRDSTLVSLPSSVWCCAPVVPAVNRTFRDSPVVDRPGPDVPFLSYTKPTGKEAGEKFAIYKAEIEFDAPCSRRPILPKPGTAAQGPLLAMPTQS